MFFNGSSLAWKYYIAPQLFIWRSNCWTYIIIEKVNVTIQERCLVFASIYIHFTLPTTLWGCYHLRLGEAGFHAQATQFVSSRTRIKALVDLTLKPVLFIGMSGHCQVWLFLQVSIRYLCWYLSDEITKKFKQVFTMATIFRIKEAHNSVH